jgi:hypothetical protein
MSETDVSDATFYSAIDQFSQQKSRKEATFDAKKQASVIAHDSDSAVPVTSSLQNVTPMKITSKNGKSLASKKSPIPGELKATHLPGEEAAKRAHLNRVVRDRAVQLAAQDARRKQ